MTMNYSHFGLRAILLAGAMVMAGQTTSFGALLSTFLSGTGAEGGAATSTVRLVRQNAADGSGQSFTYGNTSGGEFRVELEVGTNTWETIDAGSDVYKTFCLELNEHLSLSTAYTATIDDAAWYGKNLRSGSTSPEPILPGSALLYGLYFEGRLDDFTSYVYEKDSSSNDLQNALWAFEEGTTLSSGASGYDLWTWAAANAGSVSLNGTVKVLNLWTEGTTSGTGNAKQSQFIYVPGSPGGAAETVPEPASLAVWSLLGVVGLVPLRRRRRETKQ